MSVPSYGDQRLIESLRCWRVAPAGRPGSIALTGRMFYADGDGVTVLMRVAGDDALASDGGVAVTRLADAGVDVWGTTRASHAWSQILTSFHLREVDGRMVGRRPIAQADILAHDIASAMLTADGLRWLAGHERENKLARQLYDFLDRTRLKYARRPSIELPRGSTVRPTARVSAPRRQVIVQTVSPSEQGMEHALSLVQRIDRASYGFNQRLVLLQGRPEEWPADHLDLLADYTPVGFSTQMRAVEGFLQQECPLPKPLTA